MFNNSQESYFVREINRAIPTAPQMGVSPLALDSALGEPDGGRVHLDSILTDAGGGAGVVAAQRRDAACRALPYPGPGMRDPAARTGCGWWFVPDPSRPSIGAYGTRRGPMNPTLDTSIGSGQWIWDPREAQRLEGMKQAANINACPDIQFAKFPNVGWCQATGMATLADSAGNPLFANMPGGDCPGQQLIMNPSGCPPPPPPAPAGGAGGASGGTPTPAVSPSVTGLCTPVNGVLTPQCLTALLGVAQCSTATTGSNASTLAIALSNGYAGGDQNFNNTNAYLMARGFQINSGIINDGKLSMNDAIQSFEGVRQIANSGDGSLGAAAAANLCYGTLFTPCSMSPSTPRSSQPQGSWASMAGCISSAAAVRGYSQNAGLLPGKIGIAYWDQFATWGDVLANLDFWMTIAHQEGNLSQAQAIEYVYGLNLNFPPNVCPIPPVGV